MTLRDRSRSQKIIQQLDPRSLPIAFKISVGLGVVLAISTLLVALVMQNLVSSIQTATAQSDLESFSLAEGQRVIDVIGGEITVLGQFSQGSVVQQELIDHTNTYVPSDAPPSETLAFSPRPEIVNQLQIFREIHPEFDAVVLIDSEGHILGMDPVPPAVVNFTLQGIRDWKWYQTAYANGAGMTIIGNPGADPITGQNGTHIAVPVYNGFNPDELLGVIYGTWNMTNLLEVVQIGGGRQGMVILSSGEVLVSPDGVRRETLAPDLLANVGLAHVSGGHEHVEGASGSFAYTDADEQGWLYGYTTFDDIGIDDPAIASLEWIVLVQRPVSVVQASSQQLTSQVVGVLAISAALTTIMIFLFTQTLLLPLRRLTVAARQIGSGELTTFLPRTFNDEVGQLSKILGNLVSQLLYRVSQLRAASEVSRVAAVSMEIARMLDDVADSLAGKFGYTEVQIFLTESDGRHLRLQGASGEDSLRLLREGKDTYPLDETTLAGRAALLREAQIGSSTEELSAVFGVVNNELAIPLMAGGQLLGALFIRSRGKNFQQDDIDVLSLVTDQLSGSIENAQLFEQSAANLAEIEALNRLLTRQAWEEYVKEKKEIRHTLDPEQRWPELSETIRQQTTIKAEVTTDAEGRSILAVPLVLRGEVIGTLAASRSSGERWSNDEVLLVESIVSRMVTIAEGLRLIEESTLAAEREQRINEVSAQVLQRTNSVEDVLQAALTHLGGALGSNQISLRLGPPPVDGDRQITSGSSRRGQEPPEDPTGRNGDGGINDGQ